MSSVSNSQFKWPEPIEGVYQLKSDQSKQFEKVADSFGIEAVRVAKKALKDADTNGLVGVKLNENYITYYKQRDFEKVVQDVAPGILKRLKSGGEKAQEENVELLGESLPTALRDKDASVTVRKDIPLQMEAKAVATAERIKKSNFIVRWFSNIINAIYDALFKKHKVVKEENGVPLSHLITDRMAIAGDTDINTQLWEECDEKLKKVGDLSRKLKENAAVAKTDIVVSKQDRAIFEDAKKSLLLLQTNTQNLIFFSQEASEKTRLHLDLVEISKSLDLLSTWEERTNRELRIDRAENASELVRAGSFVPHAKEFVTEKLKEINNSNDSALEDLEDELEYLDEMIASIKKDKKIPEREKAIALFEEQKAQIKQQMTELYRPLKNALKEQALIFSVQNRQYLKDHAVLLVAKAKAMPDGASRSAENLETILNEQLKMKDEILSDTKKAAAETFKLTIEPKFVQLQQQLASSKSLENDPLFSKILSEVTFAELTRLKSQKPIVEEPKYAAMQFAEKEKQRMINREQLFESSPAIAAKISPREKELMEEAYDEKSPYYLEVFRSPIALGNLQYAPTAAPYFKTKETKLFSKEWQKADYYDFMALKFPLKDHERSQVLFEGEKLAKLIDEDGLETAQKEMLRAQYLAAYRLAQKLLKEDLDDGQQRTVINRLNEIRKFLSS